MFDKNARETKAAFRPCNSALFLLLDEISTGQRLKTLLVTRLQLFLDEKQSHFRAAACIYCLKADTRTHAHTLHTLTHARTAQNHNPTTWWNPWSTRTHCSVCSFLIPSSFHKYCSICCDFFFFIVLLLCYLLLFLFIKCLPDAGDWLEGQIWRCVLFPQCAASLGERDFWEMSYWQTGLQRAFGTQSQLETLSMRWGKGEGCGKVI